MFERIVAAIDNDPERSVKVVDAAKEIAQRFNARVLVAHVREVERPAAVVAGAARASALPPAITLESEEAARKLVDDAVAQLQRAGVSAQGEIGPGAEGSTARELLDIAQSYRADLIIVGDRGSRVADVLLGGVANRIVHLAECPVLLIR